MSAALTPLLAALWKRNEPLMRERLALLRRAGLQAGNPSLRLEAVSVAHKLAGSLGMFGFPRGTALARELEVGLEEGTLSGEAQLRLVDALKAELFGSD